MQSHPVDGSGGLAELGSCSKVHEELNTCKIHALDFW